MVTSGGNQVYDQGFYIYGRLRRGIIGVERSFTGQQKDANTGLIYFDACYYDPELGTFISPDTVVPRPKGIRKNLFVRTAGAKRHYTATCAYPSGLLWV